MIDDRSTSACVGRVPLPEGFIQGSKLYKKLALLVLLFAFGSYQFFWIKMAVLDDSFIIQ